MDDTFIFFYTVFGDADRSSTTFRQQKHLPSDWAVFCKLIVIAQSHSGIEVG